MSSDREQRIVGALLALTNTLVEPYDVLDFMRMLTEHSVELLGVAAAGVLLVDDRGVLSVAAASSERTRLLEIFAVGIDSGPCIDCVRTGGPVISPELADDAGHWPQFVPAATEAGFQAAYALPMRLRSEVIGALTLLHTARDTLSHSDQLLGQSLAHAATIGLLQERAVRQAEVLNEQLHGAMNSRVIIEQAKGVLAGQGNIGIDDAFELLRTYARRQGLGLTPLARRVAEGSIDLAAMIRATH